MSVACSGVELELLFFFYLGCNKGADTISRKKMVQITPHSPKVLLSVGYMLSMAIQ